MSNPLAIARTALIIGALVVALAMAIRMGRVADSYATCRADLSMCRADAAELLAAVERGEILVDVVSDSYERQLGYERRIDHLLSTAATVPADSVGVIDEQTSVGATSLLNELLARVSQTRADSGSE